MAGCIANPNCGGFVLSGPNCYFKKSEDKGTPDHNPGKSLTAYALTQRVQPPAENLAPVVSAPATPPVSEGAEASVGIPLPKNPHLRLALVRHTSIKGQGYQTEKAEIMQGIVDRTKQAYAKFIPELTLTIDWYPTYADIPGDETNLGKVADWKATQPNLAAYAAVILMTRQEIDGDSLWTGDTEGIAYDSGTCRQRNNTGIVEMQDWSGLTGGTPYETSSILIHELGHLIGMDHSDNTAMSAAPLNAFSDCAAGFKLAGFKYLQPCTPVVNQNAYRFADESVQQARDFFKTDKARCLFQ
jgi:hypothetical protein